MFPRIIFFIKAWHESCWWSSFKPSISTTCHNHLHLYLQLFFFSLDPPTLVSCALHSQNCVENLLKEEKRRLKHYNQCLFRNFISKGRKKYKQLKSNRLSRKQTLAKRNLNWKTQNIQYNLQNIPHWNHSYFWDCCSNPGQMTKVRIQSMWKSYVRKYQRKSTASPITY